MGSFPDVYLGLPLGARYKCVSIWDHLLEKFRRRLALWKRRYLSKGGRVVLIMATLQNLPVYMLSSRIAPVKVVEEIEKMIRLFLWGTREGKRKMHLVSFEGVCLPKDFGGLGIKRVREINLSLLCKWFWRLKEDGLWVRLLKEKYGTETGDFFPKRSKLPFGISVWRGLALVEPLFRQLSKFRLGNGTKIDFWNDNWCGRAPLSRIFPTVYQAAGLKTVTVCDVLHRPVDELENSLRFPDFVLTEEAANISRLRAVLGQFSLSQDEDLLVWSDGFESFNVKECCRRLIELRLLFFSPGVLLFDWDKVWNTVLPSKVSFLVWLLMRRRVLTQNNLKRRGFNMVSQCYLCKQCEEDDVHLFLECPVTQQLLDYFNFGQMATWRNSLEHFLTVWQPKSKTNQGQKIKKFIPHVAIWVLWRERNLRCFEEKQTNIDKLINEVKELAWRWALGTDQSSNLRLENVIFGWENL